MYPNKNVIILSFLRNRNREKEFEDAQVKYQQEMKICQQKIKHFMYEQHGQLSQMEVCTQKIAATDVQL